MSQLVLSATLRVGLHTVNVCEDSGGLSEVHSYAGVNAVACHGTMLSISGRISWIAAAQRGNDSIVATGVAGGARATRTLTAVTEPSPAIRVDMSIETTTGLASVTDWFESEAADPSWVWLQKAKRGQSEFTPSWDFKAPIAMLRTPATLAGIVPDVRPMTGEYLRAQPPFLDAARAMHDHRTLLSIGTGLELASLVTHSTYARALIAPNTTLKPLNGSLRWSYWVVLANGSATEGGSGGNASWSVGPFARFLWGATGAAEELRASPSLQRNFNPATLPASHGADPGTFDAWGSYAWHGFSDLFWTECGDAGGFFRQRINATGGAVGGYHSWWNSVRTSVGLWLFAARSSQPADPALQARARGAARLILRAPQSASGLFPSLADWDAGSGDGGGGEGSLSWRWDEPHGTHCCSPNGSLAHLHHASWTGYWLLRWRAVTEGSGTGGEPVPQMLLRYADHLLRSQRSDGMWPAYFDPSTGVPAAPLSMYNGESATSALFLLELHSAVGGNGSYLAAALAALNFTTREVCVITAACSFLIVQPDHEIYPGGPSCRSTPRGDGTTSRRSGRARRSPKGGAMSSQASQLRTTWRSCSRLWRTCAPTKRPAI